MILVIGAAGTCGSAVTRALVRRGARVRGFVRNEARGTVARDAGASEIAIGDLRNRESLEAAFDGVSGVFYVCPKFVADEASLGRMVIDTAARAGVTKFVYQSAVYPILTTLLHHELKRQVEVALHESNLDFTILQPARFMHNILPALPKIIASGSYVEPFSPDKPISDVDYEDVAEVAALAVTKPGYSCTTFALCAEGMLTRHQRAAILSELTGRPIRVGTCSVDEWLSAARISDPYEREARVLMFAHYDKYGIRCGDALVLRTILGREPTSFRSFLERAVAPLNATAQA